MQKETLFKLEMLAAALCIEKPWNNCGFWTIKCFFSFYLAPSSLPKTSSVWEYRKEEVIVGYHSAGLSHLPTNPFATLERMRIACWTTSTVVLVLLSFHRHFAHDPECPPFIIHPYSHVLVHTIECNVVNTVANFWWYGQHRVGARRRQSKKKYQSKNC